jgi:hypothetical protein
MAAGGLFSRGVFGGIAQKECSPASPVAIIQHRGRRLAALVTARTRPEEILL